MELILAIHSSPKWVEWEVLILSTRKDGGAGLAAHTIA